MLGDEKKGKDQKLDYETVKVNRDQSPVKFKQAALRLSRVCRSEVTPSIVNTIYDRLILQRAK
jgi:hypothetical protein